MKYQLALLTVLAVVAGCKLPFANNIPPAQRLMEPGPGVGGPGPGVMMGGTPFGGGMAPSQQTSQIAFVGPAGMQVSWDAYTPGQFDSEPLICPGRQNFPQGAIYRLKLTGIPDRPGTELYPTLEIAPSMPRTDAYLAHNSVPIQLTEEDFDQILTGNFVTKVIYLPDPDFQELALAGVETLVSTRLDPGLDPIVEADRRGAILAIVRVGNKHLEMPGDELLNGGGVAGMGYGAPYCAPGDAPPQFVAGVTSPQYGMPMSGTPIGLVGPPHVPLGGPAGLQTHVIRNHTFQHIPQPTDKLSVDVMQQPGFNYPKPPSHALITEQAISAPVLFRNPLNNKTKLVK